MAESATTDPLKDLPAEQVFRALADPTRVRILHLLREDALCVGDLVSVLRVQCAAAPPSGPRETLLGSLACGAGRRLDRTTLIRPLPFEARAAVRFHEYFSAGAALLGVLGHEGTIKTNCGTYSNDPAFKAYGGLLTMRAQSTGTIQAWAEAGAGIGHLIALRGADCFEHPVLGGRAAAAFQFSAGAQVAVMPSLALGLQLSYARWNGVVLPANAGPFANAPAVYGLSTDAWMLLATVAFDWLL